MNNTKIRKPKSSRFTGSNNRKKNHISTLDPNRLIQKQPVEKVEEKFEPSWKYEDLKLHPKLKSNIAAKGYVYPTPVQEKSLQHLLEGRDLLGIANTGTGKTAAFLIPIIEQLMKGQINIQSLVIVPTRELALQVEEEFNSLTKGMGLYASSFIGGKSVQADIVKLRKSPHILVGTPGRLLDLTNQRALRLDKISNLVIDEFDRMLDMGFIQDVKKILSGLTNRKHTMFFSATLDDNHKSLINSILNNPVEVKISSGKHTSAQVEQELIKVPEGQNKFQILLEMMTNREFEKVLIFAETKRTVNMVGKKLNQSGIRTELIHGNKSQNYRVNALNQFTRGKVQVLVATDIAARGLDITDVTHVINYQLPRTMDSYIHRIGRTGRAGKFGKAITFVD